MERMDSLNKIYINMTNRCSCSCTFCLRSLKEFNEHNSLWLKEEPSVELVKELFSKYDWSHVAEIIFCGFGEPTMRFDDVVEVARWLKSIHPDIPLRINHEWFIRFGVRRTDCKPTCRNF